MLHNAIEEGNHAMVEALLRLSRDLGLDLSRDSVAYGDLTYLQVALCNGQGRILDALLVAGADINAADGRGNMTPLHIACMGNDRGMIERLLDCKGVDVNAVDKKGRTPLHTLLEYGAGSVSVDADANVELCRLLLSRGASLDALDNDGNTPLHMTCKSWDVRLINFLEWEGVRCGCQEWDGDYRPSLPLYVGQRRERPVVHPRLFQTRGHYDPTEHVRGSHGQVALTC